MIPFAISRSILRANFTAAVGEEGGEGGGGVGSETGFNDEFSLIKNEKNVVVELENMLGIHLHE